MKKYAKVDVVVEPRANNVKFGKGVTVKDGCQLSNVIIGDNTRLGRNVTIFGARRKPVVIGKNCYIPYGCYFSGADGKNQIIIKDNVIFAPYCVILTSSGPCAPQVQSKLINRFPQRTGSVVIEDDCWIMARSTILPGVRLGREAAVAAHSLVKKSFKSSVLIGGVPAKIIRSIR